MSSHQLEEEQSLPEQKLDEIRRVLGLTGCTAERHAAKNLIEALFDLQLKEKLELNSVCLATIRRVIDQIIDVNEVLATPGRVV